MKEEGRAEGESETRAGAGEEGPMKEGKSGRDKEWDRRGRCTHRHRPIRDLCELELGDEILNG